MGRTVGIFSALFVAAICAPAAAPAAEPLLLIDQSPVDATFLGIKDNGALEFQVTTDTRAVQLRDLVRWSNPQESIDQQEAILVDGSRLILAESWAGKKSLQVSTDTVTALTESLGTVVMPRTKLRAVLLNAPASSLRRSRLRDQLVALAGEDDRLWLTNGDTLTGRLLEIEGNGSSVKFALDGISEPVLLPPERVAGLALSSSAKPPAKGNLAVGWRDGCYLVANSLASDKKSLQIKLACAVEVRGDNLRDVVHLQSLGTQAVYLSDLEATDYRHKPFLTISWQYKRDRNLLGGPLTVDRLIYAKGLAMHTASWLTYEVPKASATSGSEKRLRRFVAQVAVDDSANGRGSVVFQVFLRQAGTLQLALATPVVRGGDAPLPIAVELGDAEQIVLVVEYADRGDQRDHANWLDARLE